MKKITKIKGIKKAVGDYRRANAGGSYSPRYGRMMLDRSTGEVWTDEFYSFGQNSWKEYHDPAIIDLPGTMAETCGAAGFAVTMANVRAAAEQLCTDYQRKTAEIAE